MKANNKTYQPVQAVSIKANGDLPAFRFVSLTGALCPADSKSLGVTEAEWKSGEMASVVTLGTMTVEASATINIGQNVASDNEGRAKPASGTQAVNGRAMTTASDGDYVKILIVP